MKKTTLVLLILILSLSTKTYAQYFFGPFSDSNDKFKDKYASFFKSDERVLKTWYHYTISFNSSENKYILRLFHPEKIILLSESKFKDKKLRFKEGEAKTYFTHNKSFSTVNFINNLEEGIKNTYDSLGKISSYFNYQAGKVEGKAVNYFSENLIQRESNYKNNHLEGSSRTFYKNGKIKEDMIYVKDKLEGEFKKYDSLGILLSISIFNNNLLKSTTHYSENSTQSTSTIFDNFTNIEEMPYFRGNCDSPVDSEDFKNCNLKSFYKYIGNSVKYPVIAQKNNVSGRVFVRFVIEKDGSISNVNLISNTCESMDNESLRVIREMPNWQPGLQNTKPVRVYFSIPIVFKLD